MSSWRGLRVRYFLISFSATFLLLALLFLFLMTTVHPSTPQTLLEAASQPVEEAYEPQEEDALTVLIFGAEGADAVAGTYLLARFDPVGGQVSVAVFPPQTAMGEETLEEAYRYGGARYTKNSLAQHLGIPIDRYARMDVGSFLQAAAAVGSVEFDLSREITIADGELTVTLQPGRQLLDGRKVAALIRHRDYEGGEAARCKVVAELTCAIVDQRIDVAGSVLVDKVFETVINLVDTDISYADYEQRRQAARQMAEQGGTIAAAVELEGETGEDGRLVLHDTTLARLYSLFL